MTTAAATPSSLDVDNYQVTYIPSASSCRLSNYKDAYTYTILAEDYMAQVNLISMIGKEDPDTYYERNVLPRQSDDMKMVIAPSVGLTLREKI